MDWQMPAEQMSLTAVSIVISAHPHACSLKSSPADTANGGKLVIDP